MGTRRIWIVIGGAVAIAAILAYGYWPRGYCRSAKRKYGLELKQCPDGKLRQLVRIDGAGLQRGGDGAVTVRAQALYTVAKADEVQGTPVRSFDVDLSLAPSAGEPIALKPTEKWKRHSDGEARVAELKLPDVPDGDYLLRATVRSKVGESTVDMPLALYAPARIHVLTDRPLYEPGNVVQFRALVVRARDLTPIDQRPGTWVVRDPSGEIMLEEKSSAQEWGVVAGNFPLAGDAEHGEWSVTWRSGDDEQERSFRVEPFTLPRFRVEASPGRSYYAAGDQPMLAGAVTYSSGAPVAAASVEIRWSASGEWPPPSEWMASELPRQATTGPNGRFELELPRVPDDLRGRATLHASLAAVDPAGDRVEGTASVLLSEDAIQVSAVTELAGGLVENTNNRVYLRVSSADGTVLSGAAINVKRAWSPGDAGIDAELDADGVARIQLDPGRPVNVVIPPMPVRRQITAAAGAARRTQLIERVTQRTARLVDQVAMDRWLSRLSPCAKWIDSGSGDAQVTLRVERSGAITAVVANDGALNRCVAELVRKQRLPAGGDRLYTVGFSINASDAPRLGVETDGTPAPYDEVTELLEEAALDARDCLPTSYEGRLPWTLFWQRTVKSDKLRVSWLRDTGRDETMPAGAAQCIQARIARHVLPEPAEESALGVVRYSLWQPGSGSRERRPQPTIMQGYELLVSATVDGKPVGETTLRMTPGSVPPLRMRATPVVAKAGDEVEVKFFRSSEFRGELPEEIYWSHRGDTEKAKVDGDSKVATFQIPAGAKGWFEISGGGARALVYARSETDLALALSPAETSYAPGSSAEIRVRTEIGGKPAKAAVGLFGVDDSLAQLAPLPGPDELGEIRPAVVMTEQAFAALDARALELGRIRGGNAAEATILRVSSIPTPPEIDVVVNGSAETHFDPIADLTDHFYVALAELHAQTRDWERAAPKGELMVPATMAKLWKAALKACEARGEPIDDAFGRALRLHHLPDDLLAQTDPSQVVVDGTRLPEDVEPWTPWVRRKRP